jgi:hypothetical protein
MLSSTTFFREKATCRTTLLLETAYLKRKGSLTCGLKERGETLSQNHEYCSSCKEQYNFKLPEGFTRLVSVRAPYDSHEALVQIIGEGTFMCSGYEGQPQRLSAIYTDEAHATVLSEQYHLQ